MAENEPKVPTTDVGPSASLTDEVPRPRGWMYQRIGKGRFNLGWYASPKFQLGMVAFVCFLCPGMFNALSGLGGGGKADVKLADDMVSHDWALSYSLHLGRRLSIYGWTCFIPQTWHGQAFRPRA